MSGTIFYTGAIQNETITVTGDYTFTAVGAAGGTSTTASYAGGDGASVTGEFHLTKGDVIEILVGGVGGSGSESGGGGGGTFIYDLTTSTLLEAAGGGGGGGEGGADSGQAGTSGTSGNGTDPGAGGSGTDDAADGGAGATTPVAGGGGGGYVTSGSNDQKAGGAHGGDSFESGWTGGNFTSGGGIGGFGGGGGGGEGGGGGGGYAGGGGGGRNGGGGGGGSYVNTTTADYVSGASETGGVNSGMGFVTSDPALCYLRGTRILTPAGEVPIENLSAGDRVVTRFGGIRAIKWIGRQEFGCDEATHYPVHVLAGALGDQTPSRDLYVSPGHSMLLDGKLILAHLLLNGVSITQSTMPRIEYFNLDLGTHDCILAEGTWSETYADAPGMRAQFDNAAEYEELFPDEPPPEELTLCAPRPVAGEALIATLRRVA